MTKVDYDAAVIGGGPGGSSAATALVRRGRRVLLLERDKFPRFHIGESQLPWNNEVLRELGAFEAITGGGFMPKWGASFRRPDGVTEQYADFAHAVETPTPLSYQVDRERFDDILLRHAARSGVDVRERHRFLDAAFDADGVTVRYADADGAERSSRVAAVVDASGRAGVIVNRFGRHEYDPMLQNVAIHAQVVGVPRAEGRRAGDIRMFTRPDMGWLWLIPLTDTVMSIGAVIPKATHRREAKESAEASLDHYFAATPQAAALLERAKRTSPARVDVDYSYLATRMAGERWIAVGDSAAFLDPIFSTGVLLAMQGGIEAAEAIDAGLSNGDLSARAFARYERVVRKRYHHFRRFAVGFYDPAFREVWFAEKKRFGLYPAIVSILAGNWRPSLATRARIALFFGLIALKRLGRKDLAPAR
ncbi:MAG TPA: NAD(P)/FAD-dependent oxidoreductase [Burkholderiales bacterium]|nr:NAD(P)/FAD-dependent oxidoreductase [Burkholderiales bacterium]